MPSTGWAILPIDCGFFDRLHIGACRQVAVSPKEQASSTDMLQIVVRWQWFRSTFPDQPNRVAHGGISMVPARRVLLGRIMDCACFKVVKPYTNWHRLLHRKSWNILESARLRPRAPVITLPPRIFESVTHLVGQPCVVLANAPHQ